MPTQHLWQASEPVTPKHTLGPAQNLPFHGDPLSVGLEMGPPGVEIQAQLLSTALLGEQTPKGAQLYPGSSSLSQPPGFDIADLSPSYRGAYSTGKTGAASQGSSFLKAKPCSPAYFLFWNIPPLCTVISTSEYT